MDILLLEAHYTDKESCKLHHKNQRDKEGFFSKEIKRQLGLKH